MNNKSTFLDFGLAGFIYKTEIGDILIENASQNWKVPIATFNLVAGNSGEKWISLSPKISNIRKVWHFQHLIFQTQTQNR